MSRRLLLAAVIVAATWMESAQPAEAWVRGGYYANPYTGAYAGGRSAYNPYTNTYGRATGASNPYTGAYGYRY